MTDPRFHPPVVDFRFETRLMAPALAHSFSSSSSLGGLLNKVSIGSPSGSGGTGGSGGSGSLSWDSFRIASSSRLREGATVEVASGMTMAASGSERSYGSTPKTTQLAFQPPPPPLPTYTREFPPPLEPRSYTILKEVGDGSFGTVWLADWHSPLQLPPGTLPPGPSSRPEYKGKKLVAIKRMKKAFEGGWDECMKLKELKSLRQIPMHPNIIPLYDAFLLPSSKELYFVFECMEGNLYQLTKSRKGRPLASGLTASIFHQILEGLDHIHRNGYFHRDMKPENLLITTTGLADYPASSLYALPGTPPEKDVVVTLKLADFGLARETSSRPPYTEYVSTRWYRAPEVLLRSRDYSNPVDMWALGTILVEAITLKPLFPGESEVDQVFKICELLGDPCPDYGVDERGRVRGGGSWQRGARMAKEVGFSFPKMKPRSLASLFDSSTVSSQLIDCIADLLRYEPKARLTTQQCLQHPYFRDVAPRFSPYSHTNQSNNFANSSHSSNPPTATSRTLPPSHNNGTPAYHKPPFQPEGDGTRPSLPQPEQYAVNGTNASRHISVASSVSGFSAYGVQLVPPPEDGMYDSPMAFPENVGEGKDAFPSPAPSSVWNGNHIDPHWGRPPIAYASSSHLQSQRGIPAFGTAAQRESYAGSIAPSIAASTFYDGSIFEGIAPIRPSSIMSFPISSHGQYSPTPSNYPDSPQMQRNQSIDSNDPPVQQRSSMSENRPAEQAHASSSKTRGWGFFSGEKVQTTSASAIILQHQAAQAAQEAAALNGNPLKRTPSNASSSQTPYDSELSRAPMDPKKAKKEAEKLAKEAEKLRREMVQQASRERARAVMKKKNLLQEAADPLHNFSNHTRIVVSEKGKARAAERSLANAPPQSSKSSQHSGKMPQIAEDNSRLHVGDNRFKARRKDEDDDVHSVSSGGSGHSSQRGRAFSISSQATSASEPERRYVGHSVLEKTVGRAPSLSSLPGPSSNGQGYSSSFYGPPAPNTGHSSLDHQLIKNMQGLATSGGGGSRSPAPSERSESHGGGQYSRDTASSDQRYSPYPTSFYGRVSGQSLPPISTFDPGHLRNSSQATSSAASIQSFHSTPSVLPSQFHREDAPQLPYLPAMEYNAPPSTTFPYNTQRSDSHPQ